MDEYCIDRNNDLFENHPLSFRKLANIHFLSKLNKELELNPEQVIFPNKDNIDTLQKIIEENGGIDICYGGIGIHGHLAFNEPVPAVSSTNPRKVKLNDFTITINSIRSKVGGDLENFPKYAYTIGMQQILNSRKIRLYCRNGISLDWANTILRLALFGLPGDDYPVTHIRNHPDYLIITDQDTLNSPDIILSNR